MKTKHLGLHIPPNMHYKLHYIAKSEDRSGNGQVLHLINKCIAEYEEKNGAIPLPDESASNQ